MPPSRCHLTERFEHESAFVQPRVRQSQQWHIDDQAVIIEQVEVECAGGVADAAHPAKTGFDSEHQIQQYGRLAIRGDQCYRVDEPRLV